MLGFGVGAVGSHGLVVSVHRIQNHFAIAELGQLGHFGQVGVEHARAFVQNHIDLGANHTAHLAGFQHIVVGQLLVAIHIGDHAHQAAVVGQAFFQNGAGRGLDDGGLRQAVGQQAVGTSPVAGVGLLGLAVGDEHAFAAGHARELARQLQQPAHQAGDEGVVACADDAGDRNTASAGAIFTGEEVVGNRHAHGARCAAGGFEVHQQAGAGVDFQNGSLALHGLGHILQDHVHAGNVQTHDLGSQHGVVRHVGVYVVQAVNGHIAVALQQHGLTLGNHAVGCHTLAVEFELDGTGFQIDPVQRVLLLGTATGVLIQHFDQLTQRGLAVAIDGNGLALGGGDDLAADDQQAVFHAVDEFFNDHIRAFGLGQRESSLDVGFLGQLQGHATGVVAVRGLDGDGETNVLRHFPGFFGRSHDLAFGHGNAAGREQALGEVLVLGNAFGNGAGLVRLGRPDAALRCAVAQLHQIAVVQADMGNAALGRSIDDATGRWAQIAVVDRRLDGVDGGLEVKRLIVDGRHQELVAIFQRHAGHGLFGAAEHHAVHAALGDFTRLAELGRHAGQVQQLDDHVFHHVPHPGAAFQALDKAAALAHAAGVLDEVGQPGGQAFVEAGNLVGRIVFQLSQIQPDLQNRAVGPDTGATQESSAQELDVVEFRHVRQRINGGRAGFFRILPKMDWHCALRICIVSLVSLNAGSRVNQGVSGVRHSHVHHVDAVARMTLGAVIGGEK